MRGRGEDSARRNKAMNNKNSDRVVSAQEFWLTSSAQSRQFKSDGRSRIWLISSAQSRQFKSNGR